MGITRLLLAVVIVGSLSSTMTAGKPLMLDNYIFYFISRKKSKRLNSITAFTTTTLFLRDLDATLNTGMPQGTYCDVISGQKEGGRCTGTQVQVGGDGRAYFKISHMADDPFIAIHADSKL